MNTRQSIGLAWPPLLLRLGLAVTFIWSGWGKVFTNHTFDATQAAALANLGIISPPAGNTPSNPPATEKPPTPAGPDKPLPPSDPKPDSPNGKTSGVHRPPARPSRTAQASAEGSPFLASPPPVAAQPQTTPATPSGGGTIYRPDQFPEQTQVRSLYRLSLLIHSAATAKADGKSMALWPPALAGGKWPVWLAWAVALTELLGGFLVLIGLVTRLAALGLAGVMLGAMWLTQIGPAIQSGKTMLGFLPAHAATDIQAWMPLQWQFSLLIMSLALFFAGPGVAAIDNALFGTGPARKPAAAPPKQA